MPVAPPARVGMSLDDVDTPALVVDLDALEGNITRMARAVEGSTVRLRPHAKSRKCADCDPTVNLYDWFVCVRESKVEALWPVTARGAVW